MWSKSTYNTPLAVFPLSCKGLLCAPIAKWRWEMPKVLNGTGKALGLPGGCTQYLSMKEAKGWQLQEWHPISQKCFSSFLFSNGSLFSRQLCALATGSAWCSLSTLKLAQLAAPKEWAVQTGKREVKCLARNHQKAGHRIQVVSILHHCPIHCTVLPFNIYAPKFSTFLKNAVYLTNYQSVGCTILVSLHTLPPSVKR